MRVLTKVGQRDRLRNAREPGKELVQRQGGRFLLHARGEERISKKFLQRNGTQR